RRLRVGHHERQRNERLLLGLSRQNLDRCWFRFSCEQRHGRDWLDLHAVRRRGGFATVGQGKRNWEYRLDRVSEHICSRDMVSGANLSESEHQSGWHGNWHRQADGVALGL